MTDELVARWLDRFQVKVEKTDACWNWTAGTDAYGYGKFQIGKDSRKAHRLAWEIAHGDPGEKHVLHLCDNRRCVNPGHLYLGTNADNVRDRTERGRGQRGETHWKAKLDQESADRIRWLYASGYGSQRAIAEQYKVHPKTISDIVRGKLWTGERALA